MKLSKKQLWTLAAVVTAAGLSVVTASASRAAGPTYTVCIDIPFHPIFDYVMAKSDTYFAGKPYDVKFKVLDATTQVPAFGAGQCNVMTTPPSFIPHAQGQPLVINRPQRFTDRLKPNILSAQCSRNIDLLTLPTNTATGPNDALWPVLRIIIAG